MTSTVYLGIGSNIGNRLDNIRRVIGLVDILKDTEVIDVSPLYENPALPANENCIQSDFINGVMKIKTGLSPSTLLSALKEIEKGMGREPSSKKWGPRIIDLDILFFDNLVITDKALSVPHPEACKRPFVLKPLTDIEPEFVCPETNIPVKNLLNEKDNKNLRKIDERKL